MSIQSNLFIMNNRKLPSVPLIYPISCRRTPYRPLAVGVAQHFRLAILEYNPPCIVIEAYKCFDAYSLSGTRLVHNIIVLYLFLHHVYICNGLLVNDVVQDKELLYMY